MYVILPIWLKKADIYPQLCEEETSRNANTSSTVMGRQCIKEVRYMKLKSMNRAISSQIVQKTRKKSFLRKYIHCSLKYPAIMPSPMQLNPFAAPPDSKPKNIPLEPNHF